MKMNFASGNFQVPFCLASFVEFSNFSLNRIAGMPLIGWSEKWLRMLIFQNLTFVLPAALLGKVRGNSNFRCSLDAVLSTAMGEVNFASTSDIGLAVWRTVFKLDKHGCGENLLKSINSLYTNVKGCSLINVT